MCLYPRFIRNPRYRVEKGKYDFGAVTDYRKHFVPIGCGECIECRKQKAQQWRVRLTEELKVQKYAYFVTLTFSPEALDELVKKNECKESNAIATIAVRNFLERYRKHNKKTLRHWLITELGHEGTERIHLHGIIFPEHEITNEDLFYYWKYGKCDTGQYCNVRTINYIVKYVTKIDTDHKNYKAVILSSAGIGKAFCDTYAAKHTYKYAKDKTPEYYTLPNGQKVALPIYYRNKFFTDKERQDMWTDRLDKGEIYVMGIRIRDIDTEEAQRTYYNILAEQQERNEKLGYGNTSKEWQKEPYNITFKMLQQGRKEREAAKE